MRSDFLNFFFFCSSLISDLSRESDTERSGIIREYEEPYKCDILSAAVVVVAAAWGWEGRVRTMGKQCLQSKRTVLQASVCFHLVSKGRELLECKRITQSLLEGGIDDCKERSQNPILSPTTANELHFGFRNLVGAHLTTTDC